MALTYDIDNQLEAIVPILDEHAEWYGHVLRRIFYAENFTGENSIQRPDSFTSWYQGALESDVIEKVSLERVNAVYKDWIQVTGEVLKVTESTKEKPSYDSFDVFTTLYEEFLSQLRRLERDSVLADSGLDVVTGLRSRKAMEKDLDRELERLARKGRPFCLVVASIDNYTEYAPKMTDSEKTQVVQSVADLIKRCIRSFDDAYRSQEHEFVMSLKHADTVGGTAAIARLRSLLEENPIEISVAGKKEVVTLSYCAAEAIAGESIKSLLSNMREDLRDYKEDCNTALEYMDKSPLQRFVHNAGES